MTLGTVCDRVRAQVSLELDCELSQFERAMIRVHLARCGDCRSFAAAVRAFTVGLRAAPAEWPSGPISVPLSTKRLTHWPIRGLAQTGMAAMILLGVFGIVSEGERLDSTSLQPATQNLFHAAWSPDVEQAQLVTGAPKLWRVGSRHGVLFTS
jgi:predicted anti-sigma-YlaC factor YlaD